MQQKERGKQASGSIYVDERATIDRQRNVFWAVTAGRSHKSQTRLV
jgi:hypothetical protein